MAGEKNLFQQRLLSRISVNVALVCLTSLGISSQALAVAPTVSLSPALMQSTQTAPANGTFVAPAGISLTATATPAAGSTISKVEFYQGATLINTVTAPTVANGNNYSVNWTNVTANSYNVTAKATDNNNVTATTAPITVNVINNSAPLISLTASPQNATAPATIILNATASDTDGTITKVEFLNGINSIATVMQAPYKTNWENVAQGSYSLTAKATDNLGATTTSAPVPVTVAANAPKVYDVYTDHLETPRVVTDQNGNEVWRWDSAPFGETRPNEQPTQATAKFTFNFRFPGQYFDAESNLHYNYFRDYDPQTGRYVESDPIGLKGGINTYNYGENNPATKIDSMGLQSDGDLSLSPSRPSLPGPMDVFVPGSQANNDFRHSVNRIISKIKKVAKEMCEPTPEECKKEWSDARKYCHDAYDNGYVPGKNGRRGKGIGDMSYEQCVKGQVTEACGGSKVE